ncbi:MAG: ATP-binding protein [Deltaproteobacteria bacterium]|nr:ATP-binding protein [Deltaproteobacteria bacterium]
MLPRSFWTARIRGLLGRRNILWLAGVRRVGKTTLCRLLADATLLDCELPRVRRALEDPELFFRRQGKGLVVLDEIHRLLNPSEVLKIAADHFPEVQVVATGSSTLAARRKFRDTLAGRKHVLWLLPATLADLRDFGKLDLDERMLKGGLPPFLLGPGLDDAALREWIDSYWAKDLQELFAVDKKAAFLKFMELLFHQSGQLFEASSFAAPCEVSRQTIQNYLQILETTLVALVLRPYGGASAAEIKAQPKIYAFDTGFVCYFREWDSLRAEDRGHLLEHLVLGELLAHVPKERVFFWRDKQKHEIDFVVRPSRRPEIWAIECKAQPSRFDPSGLKAFRARHPHGTNLVVCLDLAEPLDRSLAGLEVRFVPFLRFDEELARLSPHRANAERQRP